MSRLEQLKAQIETLEWSDKVKLWDWICDEVEPHLELSDAAKTAIEDAKAGKTKYYPVKDLDK